MKCTHCSNETNNKDGFCSAKCKFAFNAKADEGLMNICPILDSRQVSKNERELQSKFLKKIGKRKAKKALCISGGVL